MSLAVQYVTSGGQNTRKLEYTLYTDNTFYPRISKRQDQKHKMAYEVNSIKGIILFI